MYRLEIQEKKKGIRGGDNDDIIWRDFGWCRKGSVRPFTNFDVLPMTRKNPPNCSLMVRVRVGIKSDVTRQQQQQRQVEGHIIKEEVKRNRNRREWKERVVESRWRGTYQAYLWAAEEAGCCCPCCCCSCRCCSCWTEDGVKVRREEAEAWHAGPYYNRRRQRGMEW